DIKPVVVDQLSLPVVSLKKISLSTGVLTELQNNCPHIPLDGAPTTVGGSTMPDPPVFEGTVHTARHLTPLNPPNPASKLLTPLARCNSPLIPRFKMVSNSHTLPATRKRLSPGTPLTPEALVEWVNAKKKPTVRSSVKASITPVIHKGEPKKKRRKKVVRVVARMPSTSRRRDVNKPSKEEQALSSRDDETFESDVSSSKQPDCRSSEKISECSTLAQQISVNIRNKTDTHKLGVACRLRKSIPVDMDASPDVANSKPVASHKTRTRTLNGKSSTKPSLGIKSAGSPYLLHTAGRVSEIRMLLMVLTAAKHHCCYTVDDDGGYGFVVRFHERNMKHHSLTPIGLTINRRWSINLCEFTIGLKPSCELKGVIFLSSLPLFTLPGFYWIIDDRSVVSALVVVVQQDNFNGPRTVRRFNSRIPQPICVDDVTSSTSSELSHQSVDHDGQRQIVIAFTGLRKDDETLLCTLVRSSPLIGYKLLSSRATAGTAHFPLDSISMKRCTHLVTINPFRRTVNLLRGLLSGVQIVSVDWLKNSAQQGLWLSELSYRMTRHFCTTRTKWIQTASQSTTNFGLNVLSLGICNEPLSPIERTCVSAQNYSGLTSPSGLPRSSRVRLLPTLFQKVGCIYVGHSSSPPRRDIIDLLTLGGASTTNRKKVANIIIGERIPEVICVKPTWVFGESDCAYIALCLHARKGQIIRLHSRPMGHNNTINVPIFVVLRSDTSSDLQEWNIMEIKLNRQLPLQGSHLLIQANSSLFCINSANTIVHRNFRLSMKFRIRTIDTGCIEHFANIVHMVSTITKNAIFRLSKDNLTFVVKERAVFGGVSAWCELDHAALFSERVCEGLSADQDEILLEVVLDQLMHCLRMSSGGTTSGTTFATSTSAVVGGPLTTGSLNPVGYASFGPPTYQTLPTVHGLKIKLVRRKVPCLAIELEQASITGRSRAVWHFLPVHVVPPRLWNEFIEPLDPDFDVSIFFPSVKILRPFVDRMKRFAKFILISANGAGELHLGVNVETLARVRLTFRGLRARSWLPEHQSRSTQGGDGDNTEEPRSAIWGGDGDDVTRGTFRDSRLEVPNHIDTTASDAADQRFVSASLDIRRFAQLLSSPRVPLSCFVCTYEQRRVSNPKNRSAETPFRCLAAVPTERNIIHEHLAQFVLIFDNCKLKFNMPAVNL
ncbi:HUS1 checkpoint protein, partial [Clonorchis sinensis]